MALNPEVINPSRLDPSLISEQPRDTNSLQSLVQPPDQSSTMQTDFTPRNARY
jgi:hypothetical protein